MLKLRNFSGAIPKLHPTLLPDSYSQLCRNARMRSGALTPFRTTTVATTLGSDAATIIKMGSAWFGYTSAGVRAVPGPVADERYYISGDGLPRVEAGADVFNLALARPSGNPSVSVVGGSVDPDNVETLVFAVTFVTSLDEESRPSVLSPEASFSPGMTLRVGSFAAAPGGRGIDRRRIYRSVTGYDGIAILHFIGEIPVATTYFDYDIDVPIAEPIPSTDYDNPPNDLVGFTSMPNGSIAGFVGRELYFSEPYRPHAWPEKYKLAVDYDIVGLSCFGSTLAIMTEGMPYIVQGTHPENMVMAKIEQNLPCLSARGIVDMGYAAVYPTHDGLVSISAVGAQIITKNLFSRDDWLDNLNPPTIVAAQHEGRYVFIYTLFGSTRAMGIIDVTGENPFFINLTVTGLDLYYDIPTSQLYILDENERDILRFDSPDGDNLTYLWLSKVFKTGGLLNFPWARTDADLADGADTVVTRIFGNALVQIAQYSDVNAPVRLPAGRLDDTFAISLAGNATIYNFGMGFDPNNLTG